ncbi:MAG: DUF2922 domain-containing protein [Defluviitaleaceae bacterium]|nr:DUF2922 domain-containing protein [Defluviitaleaceae bacterium]
MENIRETGELVFATSLGGTRTVRIPDPVANITSFMVSTAVNRMLLANPFDETVGDLVDFKHANRVTVSRIILLPV